MDNSPLVTRWQNGTNATPSNNVAFVPNNNAVPGATGQATNVQLTNNQSQSNNKANFLKNISLLKEEMDKISSEINSKKTLTSLDNSLRGNELEESGEQISDFCDFIQSNSNNPIFDRIINDANGTFWDLRNLGMTLQNNPNTVTGNSSQEKLNIIENSINKYFDRINTIINHYEEINKKAFKEIRMDKPVFGFIEKIAEEIAKQDAEEEEEEKGPKTNLEKKDKREKDKAKGKKSNPFKVLMGIVGKLLDKGWSSQDIIRNVRKTTKFNPKTIKHCVQIMKNYNKKLKRESYSLNRMSVFAAVQDEIEFISIEDDFNKKSTRELMDRLYYLNGCKKYDAGSDNGPKGSLSSIDDEIQKVKNALKNRSWTDKDINHTESIIKENRYYPLETNVEV
jgi:hypothetical protein